MAQYLRSLSTRIPTGTCLTYPAYLSVKEVSQFSSLNPHSHTFQPGLYLAGPKTPDQRERCGIKANYFQRSHLTQLDLASAAVTSPVCQSLENVNLDARLLINPQPRPNSDDKSASGYSSDKKQEPDDKPTPDQLNRVYLMLQEELPYMFSRTPDLSLFSKDIVLVDNIRGKVFHGQSAYLQQMLLLRLVAHLKYSLVKAEIVSMSQDLKNGRVIVTWRIKGVPGFRVFLKFWQIKLWDWKTAQSEQETWHDGISYYDVSGIDGKIYRHTVDKMVQDRLDVEENNKKLRLLEKLKLAGASGAFVSPLIVGTLDCMSPT